MKNTVHLIGRVGGDVDIKTLEGSSTRVASFSLATNKSWKNEAGEKQEKAQWHNISMWGAKATLAENHIKKGDLISVDGEIEYSQYDHKDGHKVNVTRIVVENVVFLTPKG